MNKNSQEQLLLKLQKQIPIHIKPQKSTYQFRKTPFHTLNDNPSIEKAVNYVKTLTFTQMLDPPKIQTFSKNKHQPIILILCQPSQQLNLNKNQIFPYTPVSYPSWLESSGAKCIPLPYNTNQGSIQFLLQRAHGLLLPGGGSNLYKSYDQKQGFGPITVGFLKIFRYIQKMWNKGINFPIWGTCLGLELMLMVISNDAKILSNLNSRGHQTQIYSQYEGSIIMEGMPIKYKYLLENKKLINFAHMHGITVKKFNNSPKLYQKLKITSISKDKDGKWFCSAIEGKDKPIFLSQFHPQKQAFQWTKKGDILSNKHSIQISQYMAQNFVKLCCRCKAQKQFSNFSQLQFYSFCQYRQVFTPQRHYKVYVIDFHYRNNTKQQRKKISEKIIPNIQTFKKILL